MRKRLETISEHRWADGFQSDALDSRSSKSGSPTVSDDSWAAVNAGEVRHFTDTARRIGAILLEMAGE